MTTSVRLQMLRLVLDREKGSEQPGPTTAGQLAQTLDEPLRVVVKQLRTLEAVGVLELARSADQADENIAVRATPLAQVYLDVNKEAV
ncbi:MAG: helix-turn-helix domain-containing protein [Dehalococcoidia bacterium]